MFMQITQIKNTRLQEYQTQPSSFILAPISIYQSISQVQIAISFINLEESLATSNKKQGIVKMSESQHKVVYHVGIGDRENFGVLAAAQAGYVKKEEDNFILGTPIAQLEQYRPHNEQQHRTAILPILQQTKVLKIQINPSSSYAYSKSQMEQNLKPIGILLIQNRQLLSMIKQIDQKMNKKVYGLPSSVRNSRKLQISRIDRGQTKVERKYQNKNGDFYQIQIQRIDKIGDDIGESRSKVSNKFRVYRCVLVSQCKINDKKYQFQFKYTIKIEKIKQCAGQINQALAKFINLNEIQRKSQPILLQSQFKRSRFKNSLHDEKQLQKQKRTGIFLDFSGKKSQYQNLSHSFRQNISIKQKKYVPESSGWLCCGRGNNDDDDAEIVVDPNDQMSFSQSQRKKGVNISKKNIDMFVGPCEGLNLFSFLDAKTINKQTFSYLQPHYY